MRSSCPPSAVFLISGLMLKTDDIKAALKHKLGVAFGFLSTLAVTPCLGFAFREIPLTPAAYTAGLTLTTAVPQTLGIGISLVRSCGGNEGLALMLTGALPGRAAAGKGPQQRGEVQPRGWHLGGGCASMVGSATGGVTGWLSCWRANCCMLRLAVKEASGCTPAPAMPGPVSNCRPLSLRCRHAAVGTNVIGIFTMPLWLKALFSGTGKQLLLHCGKVQRRKWWCAPHASLASRPPACLPHLAPGSLLSCLAPSCRLLHQDLLCSLWHGLFARFCLPAPLPIALPACQAPPECQEAVLPTLFLHAFPLVPLAQTLTCQLTWWPCWSTCLFLC